MIAYLPEIYPDELVYSWFCRYAVHSGYITNKQVLRDLYCKKSDTPIKEFIGNLNPEARTCIDKRYPIEELVLNHTMYPQYARFIPLEQKKNALYKLCYENCDVHHLFSVLPRCEKEQYLKYCPVCVREDRSKYGETYWHRKHQIRNMRICPKHKCLLCDSNVSAKSIGTYTFSAAQMVIPEEEACITIDNPLQIEFAEYLNQIFDAPVDFVNDIPISAILYHVMKDTEYMTLKGIRRDMRKFVDDLTCYYEQIGLNQIASENQIQRMMLSGENYDFSSACQIGFFLNMTVEELTASKLTEDDIKEETQSHYIKRNTAPNAEQYDTEMSDILEKVASDIYNGTADSKGKPGKVTEKFVYAMLRIKKHQIEYMPRCKAILERYSESYPEFWARKLAWGYKLLKQDQDIIFWTDLRNVVGINKKHIDEIVPHLGRYLETDQVEEVMRIIGK